MRKTFTLFLASAVIVVSAGAIAWSLAGILDLPESNGIGSLEGCSLIDDNTGDVAVSSGLNGSTVPAVKQPTHFSSYAITSLYQSEDIIAVGLNKPLLLDSAVEGFYEDPDPFHNRFHWDGSMKVTLIDVSVYDSMKAAGLENETDWYREDKPDWNARLRPGEKEVFIICTIILVNIDAKPFFDDRYNDSYFNIGIFSLGINESTSTFNPRSGFSGPVYFDGTFEGADPRQGFRFRLEESEARQFKLGYRIDEADLDKTLAIVIGVGSSTLDPLKYQLRFDITPDMLKNGINV